MTTSFRSRYVEEAQAGVSRAFDLGGGAAANLFLAVAHAEDGQQELINHDPHQ